ncbi:putative arabinose-binding protein [Frondihabitans sp. 762G35]|uniref:ABC transporter substrate-binding protein n=1 Tax=Frondihabitans sp. 762G35 TaxID=1446794 RepID=UPI000D21E0E7|nr:sugar ABC transporter substrate-binding protein [Frondihabitans sp. 762G35]ARC57938.1 putative arabinose-binding protein [Frondihabitans sp. 762G35]
MHKRLRTIAAAAVATIAVTAALAGCSSGGSTSGGSGGNAAQVDEALKKGGTLTYWSWTPSGAAQVAAFEKAYPKVKVKLVNAGTGNDEYTKLQNAVKAGSGAPDVAQVEYFALPQFALADSLTDLTQFGFDSLKSKYTSGTWGSVDLDGKLYGLPQDSGPMAMFYNKTLFDKYGIAVPKTWDEYIAAAKKLHTADPSAYITSDTGDAGFTTSMIWQAGGRPFSVDGTKLTVNLQDEGTKKWADTWNELVDGKLLAQTPGFTDDWYKQLAGGQIATQISGAWMPGVLESGAKGGSGNWRVAPIPTYDGKTAVTAENGGGAQVVMKQSKNQALAAGFVKWLNSSSGSVDTFLASGGFPSTTATLTSSSFLATKPDYFGGQAINEVLQGSSDSVASGWNYLPFQVYANSIYADTVGQSYQNAGDLNSGLKAWQAAIVKYGNEQGFTVSSK